LTRLSQVLGVEFPVQAVMDALTRLRLSPVLQGERIDVTVPSYRLDLNQEIDLVEEVARVIGYDKIPVRDEIRIRLAGVDPVSKATETIRSTLVAGGYFEAVTFSFVTDALAGAFKPAEAASLPRADARVRKADAHLRPSILPGLLEAVRHNESAGVAGAKLFEIGSAFWIDGAGKIQERRRIGLVGGTDFREVRGVVESVLSELDGNRAMRVTADNRPGFADGAAGKIHWGAETIGHIGRIDQPIADQLSLREVRFAAELDLPAMLNGAQHVPQLHPLPRFPAVRRDVSLVLPEGTEYEKVEAVVHSVHPQDLEAVDYVTTYRGKPLESGVKSVTITLVFRSPTTTLTSEAVESSVQRVIGAAKEKLGATLRA
jgi:phenylalanyl-tRNA synthetase beta chain